MKIMKIMKIMNYENYNFAEAIKMLADRAGVKLPEIEYSEEMKKKENQKKKIGGITYE